MSRLLTLRKQASQIGDGDLNLPALMKISMKVAAIAGLVGLTVPAAAQTPVAVVEDVHGKVTRAEFVDYVAPGKSKLGPVVLLSFRDRSFRDRDQPARFPGRESCLSR